MTFLSISLLIFSITIIFFTIISIYWWKKYGKPLFLMLKDLKNTTNQSNLMGDLSNLEDFYRNMGNFGGQIGNFSARMDKLYKNLPKNR